MSSSSTIAAIATPFGQGALSVIRVVGPDAFAVVAACWKGKSIVKLSAPGLSYGVIVDAEGEKIDEVVLAKFCGPKSFTGEDTIEITGHGGILITQKLYQRLLECGAEAAGPGEFSQRAFINGKLDLTQAEAIMDLISAQSELSLKAAHQQLDGKLGQKTLQLRDDLLGILAHVEAYIDFPDEDIDPETGQLLLDRMDAIQSSIHGLLATANQGRILREGARTVIAGAPNVGKSSLLNQLLGFQRAIVSEQAGTTRDTVEEQVNLRGIPLRLIDTAGIHQTEDVIEQQGIDRTHRQLQQADLILELVDANQPRGVSLANADWPKTAHLMVLNKADLGEHADWQGVDGVRISSLTGDGLDKLADAVLEKLSADGSQWGANLVAINARHQQCLQQAREALQRGRDQIAMGFSPEFASVDLREAMDALGEMVGKLDTEDLLGEIFSSFCIGK